ncbi:MAG: cell division protein FtsL [Bacillaceae bacterium]|nr:cell division protein FtsL [Bacillaceae bacterium]
MAAQTARKLENNRVVRQGQQVQKKIAVQRRRWVTKGEKFLFSLFALLSISAAIYVISYSASIDSINRDIQTVESQIHHQQLENRVLEAKVNELKKPSRILEIAKKHGLTIKDSSVKQASPVQ